jgi:tetratricopeptide (TPR) repeat protein
MVSIRLLIAAASTLVVLAYAPRTDLEAGHYLKALAEADVQLRTSPSDALAWAAKSQALTALQRFDEALAAAERALALNPGLPDGLQARGLARAGTAVQQRSFSSLRNASGALDDLQAAVQADPKLTTAWLALGLAYQQLPGLLGGSTRKALKCAEGLRQVDPPRGDLLRGSILSLDGRWQEAEPCFARALAAAPSDPEIIYGYLEALGSRETRKGLGEGEQKRRLALEARRLLPHARTSARSVTAVSEALLDANQPEEAWTIVKEGLGQVDAPSLLRLQLGKLAARAGLHREEGLAMLDQVLREPLEGGSGGYPTAHWRRGQILKDLGRKAEARAAAEAALKLDPKHPGATKLLQDLSR